MIRSDDLWCGLTYEQYCESFAPINPNRYITVEDGKRVVVEVQPDGTRKIVG